MFEEEIFFSDLSDRGLTLSAQVVAEAGEDNNGGLEEEGIEATGEAETWFGGAEPSILLEEGFVPSTTFTGTVGTERGGEERLGFGTGEGREILGETRKEARRSAAETPIEEEGGAEGLGTPKSDTIGRNGGTVEAEGEGENEEGREGETGTGREREESGGSGGEGGGRGRFPAEAGGFGPEASM